MSAKDKPPPADASEIRLTAHPRAVRHIDQGKGWGGLLGFAFVALVAWRAGLPAFDVGLRALLGGVAGYLVGWACAVHVWRHLAVAEVRAAQRLAFAAAAEEQRRRAQEGASAEAPAR